MHQSHIHSARTEGLDAGLRTHMLRVYNLMAGGMGLSAAVAAAVAYTPLGAPFLTVGPHGPHLGALGIVAMLAPLAMLLAATLGSPGRWSAGATAAFYWAFAGLQGVGLSLSLLAYGGADVTRALLATTAAFAGLSIWGYSTKRDLGPVASFCMMGLFGLLAVGLLSLVTGFNPGNALMGAIGIIVFSGLVAYDTQKTRDAYLSGSAEPVRAAYWAALSLYLDAVNLFLSILRLGRSD